MRPANIFTKTLFDQRFQVVGFGLGLAVIAALDVYIWPSYRDALQNFEIPPAFEALFGGDLNLATGAGFLSAEFYSWVHILLLVFAIIQGTGAIAGEESGGTMDLVLAQPVSRRAVVVEKLAASVLSLVAIVGIGYLGWLISVPFVDIEVSLADVLLANINILPLVLMFYALSLVAGAVAPTRGVAAAAVVGLATVAYFTQTVAASVDALSGLKYLTPFYYYGNGDPLVHGLTWWRIAPLLALAAAFVIVALRTFERRDVSAGGASDLSAAGLVRRLVGARTGI